MAHETEKGLAGLAWPDLARSIRARTPARLLAGRVGAAYRTDTQLELPDAHAAARDSVRDELDLEGTLGSGLVKKWDLFDVFTRAGNKDEYLLRPDLGRHFSEASRRVVLERCPKNSDLQIAVGDGLSVSAVAAQVPQLLPLLYEGAAARDWKIGQSFVIHHCRVGILNEIGELLNPRIVVLLIGERPGLATAESLSAYMAYRPRLTHSDANRNVISNIHSRGVSSEQAAFRTLTLGVRMITAKVSGCTLQEQLVAG